jgi:anaerobic selenocysteine-containing dehydrogenase
VAVRQRGASIPVSRIVEMLENPGKPFDFKERRVNCPDVKLAYWVGGNPFAHHQDRNQRNLETFIVHDFQLTATARHADIGCRPLRATSATTSSKSVTTHSGDEKGHRAGTSDYGAMSVHRYWSADVIRRLSPPVKLHTQSLDWLDASSRRQKM